MMTLPRGRFVLVALGVVTAGAIAFLSLGGAGSSEEFKDVPQLVGQLKEAGIECGSPQVSDIALAESVGGQFGSCQIDGDTVNIHVYFVDPDRVAEHIKNNVSVRGQSPTYFTSLVAGSNWVVDTYSETTSKKVQAAVGGTIH